MKKTLWPLFTLLFSRTKTLSFIFEIRTHFFAKHAKPLLTPAVNTRPPIEELGMEQRLYGKNLLVKVVIAALVCSRNL
ncbi:Dynein-1-beta heavy chain, flagellar inner arm I1 complex [Gossypium arboreum]|uniref:Dynein-1-beta heavy chain, flagellar inner arm I1 complex n=1 Tax=Gossypium arboreum TaxID=29729 RepID=A0A0B0PQ17_GOSAR|nr:Dynein-1-beta heavy chain, flagellar inner arm I1 complex [Gossypium arboreum]KHG30181.1 Dynein-1-beta heavy chain, flagellar inner arm I1 complex [Gossypium arboreum]